MSDKTPNTLGSQSLTPNGNVKAAGIATPQADKSGIRVLVPSRKVIPIVFLPGIMGSNLRLLPAAQQGIQKKDNIAWRPDRNGFLWDMWNASAATRQRLLNPDNVEVDIYEPAKDIPKVGEAADARHDNVKISCASPWLTDDPKTVHNARSAIQKARARGWGEIMFDSYGVFLNYLEDAMHNVIREGKPQGRWTELIGVKPAQWGMLRDCPDEPLTIDHLKKIAKAWFPVHAMGYNWLKSNGEAGKTLAVRIDELIEKYRKLNFECEKVIIVTHSMGGIAARALVHSSYGNCSDKVLGVVHGVMPTIGAPAGYKRLKAGFEGTEAHVLGKNGLEVTAVLAHSPGGLELLPSAQYTAGWLRIVSKGGTVFKTLPEGNDPYSDIYLKSGCWWALINPAWINPAGLPVAGQLRLVFERIAYVKKFHEAIAGKFHTHTYATFGNDRAHSPYGVVEWQMSAEGSTAATIDSLPVQEDKGEGKVRFSAAYDGSEQNSKSSTVFAAIQAPTAAGDGTVPVSSANAVVGCAILQSGYEHQKSYQNVMVQRSTLHFIVRAALTWDSLGK